MTSFSTLASSVLSPFARRFVAGTTAAEAIRVAQSLNSRRIKGVLDFLGEDVTSPEQARAAVREYENMLDRIHAEKVDAAISVKMSQMGLTLSPELCLNNLQQIAVHARDRQNVMWIDMEGSALTQKTVDLFEQLHAGYANVGLCLQAYLVRTGGDLDRLIRRPVRIRLCKGAYKEPPHIAFASKHAVDGNYRALAQKLLEAISRQVYPAFATHDDPLIQEILKMAQEKKVPPAQFEFEMLYGIRNQRLTELAQQGYTARVYIPYGTAWMPYFIRRLRERKENIAFLLSNLFKK